MKLKLSLFVQFFFIAIGVTAAFYSLALALIVQLFFGGYQLLAGIAGLIQFRKLERPAKTRLVIYFLLIGLWFESSSIGNLGLNTATYEWTFLMILPLSIAAFYVVHEALMVHYRSRKRGNFLPNLQF